MAQRIKTSSREGQFCRIGDCNPAATRIIVLQRPFTGDMQSLYRQIDQRNITSGKLGQIKSRPTGTGSQIKQHRMLSELQ